jgi:hypothetical protein
LDLNQEFAERRGEGIKYFFLALQLPFCFEVCALSGSLVRSTPE